MDTQKLIQQDSLTPSVFQPSAMLLENWKLWISHEIVGQWQQSSGEESQLIILDIDDKDFYSRALNKLQSKIQSEKLDLNALENFEQLQSRIQELFNEIVLSLQERLKGKKSRCFITFRESLSANFNSLSPKNVSVMIAEHTKLLTKRRDYFDNEKNTHLQRQASAGMVCINQVKKLQSTIDNSLDYNCIKESVWNALNIYFHSKLLVARYTVLLSSTIELLESCRSYQGTINSSSEVLEQIQESLREKSSLHLLSIPVFSYLDKIDASEQKHKIESHVGQRINHWGSNHISWQEIEEQLLINVEPITLEIYQEFQKCFLEHGVLFANQSN